MRRAADDSAVMLEASRFTTIFLDIVGNRAIDYGPSPFGYNAWEPEADNADDISYEWDSHVQFNKADVATAYRLAEYAIAAAGLNRADVEVNAYDEGAYYEGHIVCHVSKKFKR